MSRDDPHRDAFKAAVAATRARIRRDRARAPKALKKVFTAVAARLLHPSLNAAKAWKAAGVRDRSLTAEFRAFAKVSLKQYIEACRIEIAAVLMEITYLDLYSISEKIGYTHYPTFTDAFRRQKNILPSDVVRQHLPPPEVGDGTSLRAGRGVLDDDAFVRYVKDLLPMYPAAEKHVHIGPCPEQLIIVNGAGDDRLKAEDLWRKIRDLPFDMQCQKVRGYRFGSTVLFDLLRKESLLVGRKSRQRAIEVAKLMLVSLETSDEVFEERIHDLRAFAWAWLGNAYQLAFDFPAAVEAFEQADHEWSRPRAKPDLLVLADISRLKGMLLMVRREYAQATQELDLSCSLFQQLDQTRGEATALIKRATIHGYAGKLGKAVEDLREAMGLIDVDHEKDLAFAVRVNLGLALVRAGEAESAAQELKQARKLSHHLEDPLATITLNWIEGDLGELLGDLKKAREFYTGVRAQLCPIEHSRYLGKISVDLMTIHSQLGEWKTVGELAVATLPILTAMQLHSETVATVDLLAEAIKAGSVSRRILQDLRAVLRQDPLTM